MPTPTIANEQVGDGRVKASPQADATREYVSGGTYQWAATWVRTLPFWIDDVTRDFGRDLYDRIKLDPQVSALLRLLKTAALRQGLSFLPAVEEDEPNYAQAQELVAFAERSFARLDGFLTATLFNMLDALAVGNKVAELVYELVAEDGPDTGKLVWKAWKVKRRESLAFVVDPYFNLIGFLALIPGQAFSVVLNQVIGDVRKVPNLLPRDKFALLTINPEDEDPRGTGWLRPVYTPWWGKLQTYPEYIKYLARFASPCVIGYTAEKATTDYQRDDTGNIVYDTNNNPTVRTPEQVMLESLQALYNGTAAAFPFGAKVEPLEMKGEGAPYIAAFGLFNSEIEKAMTCQNLATSEGKHQARAAAQTHQDALGLVIGYIRSCVAEMLERALRLLIRYNFPPDAWNLIPSISLGDVNEEDFATVATALAALNTSAFFEPEQMPGLDVRLGVPVRSEESVAKAIERRDNPPEEQAADPAAAGGGAA